MTNRMEALTASSEKLMNVRLMPNVPDKQIFWSMKDRVKSHRQLNYAKIRSQMTSSHRNFFDDLIPHFLCQLFHLSKCHSTQLLWTINTIKNPCQGFPPNR